MPRPKLPNGQYADTLPECPVCGDPITWLYNHYGRLKGYATEHLENNGQYVNHYPLCPNLAESVMLPLSMKEHIERHVETTKKEV